jgi:hypothetical protein
VAGARWWAAGGAAQGAGKGVEGVHGISAELGAVLGGSERDRSNDPLWLNDGKHGGVVAAKEAEEEEGSLHGGGRGGEVLLL